MRDIGGSQPIGGRELPKLLSQGLWSPQQLQCRQTPGFPGTFWVPQGHYSQLGSLLCLLHGLCGSGGRRELVGFNFAQPAGLGTGSWFVLG